VRWPLQRARIAAQFTTAVCTNGLTLAAVSQSHLDAWLVELPSHRTALRAFVQWATSHRYLAADLEVPAPIIRERRAAMDDIDRLQLTRTLLRERDEDLPARLAGVLVLLFGQLVTRLCLLERTAVTVDDDGRVSIALSDTRCGCANPWPGWRCRSPTEPSNRARRGYSPAARATGRCRRTGSGNASPSSVSPGCWKRATALLARWPRSFHRR
jgi:hypothetical protein